MTGNRPEPANGWGSQYHQPDMRWDDTPTVTFPAIRIDREPLPPRQTPPTTLAGQDTERSQSNSRLLAASGSIAIATLVSRITGFMKQLLLLATLGAAVASAYTISSQIPNMISEFVLGAVLTAIVVPVLVRAEREDPDQGAAFVRRLFTISVCLLGGAALFATAAAPILTNYVFLEADSKVNASLTTALTYLLLPAILFYGLSALFTAILNTRQVFKPGAWAPVLNNIVVLTMLVLYWVLPGEISLDPVRMGEPKLLLLGIGVTTGVVVQALSLVPALRREKVSLRPLWGLDDRLKQFGGMAAAIMLYVAISQIGMIVATRVSGGADDAGPAIYNNAWLLLQLPYGVLGVTVLTAIMPRLSRNAAAEDNPAVVDDLGVATRMTMIALLPIITFLTFAGPQVGQALYAYGNFGVADATRLGEAVRWSAFTLIPYSLVLIHLRVFYAREQAWTPTWIVLGVTGVKVTLSLMVPVLVNPDRVVILLGTANGFSYAVGALIGGYLLHRALGNLRMANVGRTVWRVLAASLVAAFVVVTFDWIIGLDRLSSEFGGPGSIIRVAITGLLMLVITFVLLWFAKIPEVVSVTVALTRKIRAHRGLPEMQKVDPATEAPTDVLPAIGRELWQDAQRPLPYAGRGRDDAQPGNDRRGTYFGGPFEGEGVRVSDDDHADVKEAGRSTKTVRTAGPGSGRPNSPAPIAKSDAPTADEPTQGSVTDESATSPAPAPTEVFGAITEGDDEHGDSAATSTAEEINDGATDSEDAAAPESGAEHVVAEDETTAIAADQLPADAGPGRVPRGPKLIPGASVAGGRYRLLTPHGGARGLQFWQALDVKLDREVALTFVDADQRATSAGSDGPQAILSRTLRLGRISSPGLARVLDVVRGSSGGIVVAEWTPGRSLREMADTKPSPIGAARAIRALAAAAETAHRAGGALSIDHPDRVRISITGDAVLAFPGTLANADAAADVRGLGAMLYALITSKWPLPAPGSSGTNRTGTVGGMRLADRDSSGQPMGPRVLRPEVPFEISAVALRSLEPNGGIRTAATVQHILDQATVVNDKTELIPAVRLGQRPESVHSLADPDAVAEEKRKSNRMLIALAGLAFVTIVVLALLGFWLANFLAGSGSNESLNQQQFGLTSETPAPTEDSGSTTGNTETPAAQTFTVQPEGVAVFSPQGTPDGAANARLVLDGNPATVWSTDAYFQPFPSLKNGVGLMVTLPEATRLTDVWINSPTPGTTVEIRSAASSNPTLDQTQIIGNATLGSGVTEIPVNSDNPTRNVLVWITGLSNTNGSNQSRIADVGFTGVQ